MSQSFTQRIQSETAPAPVGPYSQAVARDGILYASGQIPLDPATGKLVEGEIEEQARRVMANLSAVLQAGGSSLEHVLRTSIYLVDLSLFARVNAVYATHFTGDPAPARSTIGVAALPLGAQIEMDVIAAVPR